MTNNKTKRDSSHALSGVQSDVLLTAAGEGKRVITFEEIWKRSGLNRQRLRSVLVELTKRGWLKRISRGLYMIVPVEAGRERSFTESSLIIAKHLMPEGAISHWTALNYHGLTEQLPLGVFISSFKRKRSCDVMGVHYTFVTIDRHSFFGHEDVWIENEKVRITDRERTLVDAVWMPRHCGGTATILGSLDQNLGSTLDGRKLTDYLHKLRSVVLFKRLGFLNDMMGWKIPQSEAWQGMIDKNYNLLDPDGPKEGDVNSKWRLKVNI